MLNAEKKSILHTCKTRHEYSFQIGTCTRLYNNLIVALSSSKFVRANKQLVSNHYRVGPVTTNRTHALHEMAVHPFQEIMDPMRDPANRRHKQRFA